MLVLDGFNLNHFCKFDISRKFKAILVWYWTLPKILFFIQHQYEVLSKFNSIPPQQAPWTRSDSHRTIRVSGGDSRWSSWWKQIPTICMHAGRYGRQLNLFVGCFLSWLCALFTLHFSATSWPIKRCVKKPTKIQSLMNAKVSQLRF